MEDLTGKEDLFELRSNQVDFSRQRPRGKAKLGVLKKQQKQYDWRSRREGEWEETSQKMGKHQIIWV